MRRAIDPRCRLSKRALQVVGPVVLIVGIIFSAVGLHDLFSAEDGRPTLFWMAFIGLLLAGYGLTLCKWAFLGEISRYGAGEVASVARDSLDYLGLSAMSICTNCGASSAATAKFCSSCGRALTVACRSCGQANAAGVEFCQNCGAQL